MVARAFTMCRERVQCAFGVSIESAFGVSRDSSAWVVARPFTMYRDGSVQPVISAWTALDLSGYHSGAPQGHYDVGLDSDRNLKMQLHN